MTFRQQQLNAPKHHGEALIVPQLSNTKSLLDENLATTSTHNFSIERQPIDQFRKLARQELVLWARQYTRAYRSVDDRFDQNALPPVAIAGHQPELFHPGVWFKNRVLSQLGAGLGCLPINLVIDNDLCGITKISVPSGDRENPKIKRVPFDQGGRNIPFECRKISDQEIFDWFGKRVSQAIKPFVDSPLVEELWPLAMEAARESDNLGRALAQARHQIEQQLNWQTLELPLSRVCRSQYFASFASEIINRLDEFHLAYNQTIRDYRSVNAIKSAARPVPELKQIDGYLETPFWIWNKANPLRRALYVKQTASQIELSDLRHFTLEVPAEKLVDVLRVYESDFAVRPKALLTTMYSRLVLSDVFVHGIGGAKYDELTDEIASRFFGVQLPRHLTATATMKLPIAGTLSSQDEVAEFQQQLRELEFHAEKYLDHPSGGEQKLIARKQHLIQALPENGSRKSWHHDISKTNAALQRAVIQKRELVSSHLADARKSLRRNQLLSSREFSFCLFDNSLFADFNNVARFPGER